MSFPPLIKTEPSIESNNETDVSSSKIKCEVDNNYTGYNEDYNFEEESHDVKDVLSNTKKRSDNFIKTQIFTSNVEESKNNLGRLLPREQQRTESQENCSLETTESIFSLNAATLQPLKKMKKVINTNIKERKLKRKCISMETKIKILDQMSSGEKPYQISKKFNLNEATIRTIKRNEEKIRNRVSIGSSAYQIVRVTNNLLCRVENCLMIWIEDCHQKDIPMNGHTIRKKALKLFTHLKETETDSEAHQTKFVASNGWLHRFKKRFSLLNIKIHGEHSSSDIDAAKFFSKEIKNIIEKDGYSPDQVFNCDETGLNWKKMPERANINEAEKSALRFNVAENRISLIFCINASGDYIAKPMFINHCLNPHAMNGVDEFNLPVYWRANKNTWVTRSIFHDWFYNCFIPEVENYIKSKNIVFKILLIIDSAPSHPTDLYHPNVRVIFIPPNIQLLIQPMDQGVIKTFKLYYIRRTFQLILNQLHSNPGVTLMQTWKSFSILNCIEIIDLSIKELKSSILNACWRSIWPEIVKKENVISPLVEESRRIINIAQLIGGKGFVDMNENDIEELIDNEVELSEVELIQLVNELDTNYISSREESMKISFKELIGNEKKFSGEELIHRVNEHGTNYINRRKEDIEICFEGFSKKSIKNENESSKVELMVHKPNTNYINMKEDIEISFEGFRMGLINNEKESSGERIIQTLNKPDTNCINSIKGFSVESLNEKIQMAKELESYFTLNDPVQKRSVEFKRKFADCLAPYYKILKELQTKVNVNIETLENIK